MSESVEGPLDFCFFIYKFDNAQNRSRVSNRFSGALEYKKAGSSQDREGAI